MSLNFIVFWSGGNLRLKFDFKFPKRFGECFIPLTNRTTNLWISYLITAFRSFSLLACTVLVVVYKQALDWLTTIVLCSYWLLFIKPNSLTDFHRSLKLMTTVFLLNNCHWSFQLLTTVHQTQFIDRLLVFLVANDDCSSMTNCHCSLQLLTTVLQTHVTTEELALI